jgi:hypothetical protein
MQPASQPSPAVDVYDPRLVAERRALDESAAQLREAELALRAGGLGSLADSCAALRDQLCGELVARSTSVLLGAAS